MSISNLLYGNSYKLTCAGLDAGKNKITNVAPPVDDYDCPNKAYVDSQIDSHSGTLSQVLAAGNDGNGDDMLNIGEIQANTLSLTAPLTTKSVIITGEPIAGSNTKSGIRFPNNDPIYMESNFNGSLAYSPGLLLSGQDNSDRSIYMYSGNKAGNQRNNDFNTTYSVKVGENELVSNMNNLVLFKSPTPSTEAQRKTPHNIIFNDGDDGLPDGKTAQISMVGDPSPTSGVKGNIIFSVQNGDVVPGSVFSETMRVRGNRVGIMTSDPGAELEVVGEVKTDTLYVGDHSLVVNNAASGQLSVGSSNQPTAHLCARFRSPAASPSESGQLFMEAGTDAGGTRPGWSSLSWNGYLNGSTGYFRTNANKQIWQMKVDQRTGDSFSINSLNPVDPLTPTTINWLNCDGANAMYLNSMMVLDALTPVVRPETDNTIDLGYNTFRWKDVYSANGTIQTSDLNKKKDVNDLTKGLDFINTLRPVEYKFKENTSDRVHYGLIAQEVETVFNNLGDSDLTGNATVIKSQKMIPDPNFIPQSDGTGTIQKTPLIEGEGFDYSLRYTEFIAPLIKAVQELTAKNAELMARVEALENA